LSNRIDHPRHTLVPTCQINSRIAKKKVTPCRKEDVRTPKMYNLNPIAKQLENAILRKIRALDITPKRPETPCNKENTILRKIRILDVTPQ